MTEEERRRLYGPEKGYYNADEEVYEDLQTAAEQNAQAEAAQMQGDIDHPMLDANKAPSGAVNTIINNANTPAATQPVQPAVNTTTASTDGQPSVTPQPAPQESPYERFKREDAEEYQKVLNGQKRLEDYWAERLRQHDADVKAAEEENERRTQMEGRRASMVNAAGLAASLFNLYAVGGLHASNQVYRDHTQDWMRKADADRRMRRARIDNLRDRQRGIQDKLEGLRAANTQDAYNRWRNQAAADAAAAQKDADRQKAEEAALAKRDADMQTKGFIPDPNSETGYRFDLQLAREIALSKSIRAASGRVTSSPQKGGSSKRETTSPAATSKGTPAKSSSANAGAPMQANPATNAASSVPFYLNPTSQPAATVATTANGNNAQKAGGFKDWAYRMPHEESEFKKKREFFGWPDPKAGTPINPPKPANPPKQEEEKPKKTGTWEDEF